MTPTALDAAGLVLSAPAAWRVFHACHETVEAALDEIALGIEKTGSHVAAPLLRGDELKR
jgi:hypothetical protein